MKKQITLTLLVATVEIMTISTQAQIIDTAYNYDLLIGFSSGSGNDLIYDLGSVSSLSNGKTWNLATLTSGYNLNNVNWGVVGDVQPPIAPLPRSSYMTFDPTFGGPIDVSGNAAWSQINTAVKSMYQNFTNAAAGQYVSIGVGNDNSWYSQTLNPTLGTQYQSVNGNPNVAGLTSVPFYYEPANNTSPQVIGSFSLAANGIVAYNVASATPPAPQIVSVTRAGNNSTIYFTTTNGTYTYVLYYTNSSGLAVSVTSWPSSPTTLTGNGNTNSLSDTTTDTNRFYRIGVH